MEDDKLNRIRDNVNLKIFVAKTTGIGITNVEREMLYLLNYIDNLESEIEELKNDKEYLEDKVRELETPKDEYNCECYEPDYL